MIIRRATLAFCLAALPFCLAAALAAPAHADKATEAMQNALSLYRQGNLGRAYVKIEDAAAAIERIYSARYAKTFPRAPRGWRADAVKSSAATKKQLGRGMSLSRNYVMPGATSVAKAELLVDDSGLVAGLIENLKKRGNSPHGGTRPIEIKGAGTAYLSGNPQSRYMTLSILIDRRFYIRISANRVDRPDVVVQQILKGWDFAALRKAGGLK